MSQWFQSRAAAGFLVGSVWLTPSALADFRDDYRQGVAAMEFEEWAQAATLFRQAAAERPEEKARLSRSPFSKRYLPHFYLGQALLGMGDCEGALAAWSESERQGVISRLPEYQALARGRETCRAQQASRLDATRQAEVELENAMAAAQRVDRLRIELGSEWASSGSGRSTRYAEAEARLASARRRVDDAQAAGDIDGLRRAASTAREARDLLEALELEAIHLQGELRVQQGALKAEVGRLREQAEQQLQATAWLRPYPRQIGRLVSRVSELIDESRRPEIEQDAARLDETRSELESALVRLREATAPPPEALSEAARAFFDSDYETALDLLEDLDTTSRRVAVEAHILRAAASFSLYQLGADGSAELLETAQAEVSSCLELDSTKRPPAGPFSPRFVEFFDSQVGSGAAEETIAEVTAIDGSDRVEE